MKHFPLATNKSPNATIKTLGRSLRIGRLTVPVWMIGVAALIMAGVAGQAIGPVLSGVISGSGGLTLEQAVVLNCGPSVSGADDSVAIVNDEGSSFIVALETDTGQSQTVTLALTNNSDAIANAILDLDAPLGLDIEVGDAGRVNEAELTRNSWLFNVDSRSAILAGETFSTFAVDSAGLVGKGASITVVDDCTIFISYFDDTNDQLKVARSTDGGATFSTSVADSSVVVNPTSITAPNADTVFVSYFDDNSNQLRFAKSTDGGRTFATSTVDTVGSFGSFTFVDNSIAALDVSNIFISYVEVDDSERLKLAKSTDWGANFTEIIVETAIEHGFFNSIAVVPDNTPNDGPTVFISYQDDASDDLEVAKSTDGGDTFPFKKTLDAGANPGQGNSIAAVDANDVFISYITSSDDLALAKTADGFVNFTTSVVDTIGTIGRSTSIAALDASNIFISYRRSDTTTDDVKFARSTDGGTTFTKSTVDSAGGAGIDFVVQGNSIAAVDANNIFISYNDGTSNDLKFAVQYLASLAITIEFNDAIRPGSNTMTGRIVQTSK